MEVNCFAIQVNCVFNEANFTEAKFEDDTQEISTLKCVSLVRYSHTVWVKNVNIVIKLIILLKKKNKNHKFPRPHPRPFFCSNNILKFGDKSTLKKFFTSVNQSTDQGSI